MIQIFGNLYVKQSSIDARHYGWKWVDKGTVLVLASNNFGYTILMNIFKGLTHQIHNNFLTNFYFYETLEEALIDLKEQNWVSISIDEVPNGTSFIKKGIDVLEIN